MWKGGVVDEELKCVEGAATAMSLPNFKLSLIYQANQYVTELDPKAEGVPFLWVCLADLETSNAKARGGIQTSRARKRKPFS